MHHISQILVRRRPLLVSFRHTNLSMISLPLAPPVPYNQVNAISFRLKAYRGLTPNAASAFGGVVSGPSILHHLSNLLNYTNASPLYAGPDPALPHHFTRSSRPIQVAMNSGDGDNTMTTNCMSGVPWLGLVA